MTKKSHTMAKPAGYLCIPDLAMLISEPEDIVYSAVCRGVAPVLKIGRARYVKESDATTIKAEIRRASFYSHQKRRDYQQRHRIIEGAYTDLSKMSPPGAYRVR